MGFIDVFIRRPLLAWVLNALILLFGLIAFNNINLRPYPKVESAIVSIYTAYPGASADIVQGFVTGPLQRAIIGAEGIDYFTSITNDGFSAISIYAAQGYDTGRVMTDIIGKIASVRSELPPNALEPVVDKFSGDTPPVWVQVRDPNMTPEQVTEFYYRVLRPKLAVVEGASGLNVIGERPFAMRLWLDPLRMAAVGVTASELQNAILANNFISESGEIRSGTMVQPVRAATDVNSAEAFADIVIRKDDDAVIRLRDVATVELSSAVSRQKGFVDQEPALLVGLQMAPDSNPLKLSRNVRQAVEELQPQLTSGTTVKVFYDLGLFVDRALTQVTQTLFEALAIVAVITLLFFGNPRSVLIMLISIPLSLVGTFLFMWMLGYSLNLFTLLALVIAIGLVVDDTIVVVENIHRYIEKGMAPVKAAIIGAREVAIPVIAMSLTLVAVFLPVGLMQGLSGQLIREFVFTLAGSVAISGIIALTLSPMLCSRILKPESDNSIAHWLDSRFDDLRHRYANALKSTLQYRPVWLMVALVMIGSIPVLLSLSEEELVPLEDTGYVHVAFSTPPHFSDVYTTAKAQRIEEEFNKLPGIFSTLRFEGLQDDGTSMAVAEFVPWDEREFSVIDYRDRLQATLNKVPGIEATVFIIDVSPAGAAGPVPIQVAIQTTDNYRNLAAVSDRFAQAARESGNFLFVGNGFKFSQPQIVVEINRDAAWELGVDMADIATTLSAMLGEGYINRFSYEGESYDVVPQASATSRLDRASLNSFYVKTASGESIPLGALIETSLTSKPRGLSQFNGLNSATISMVPTPGVSMQQAIDFLNEKKNEILPHGYSIDYAGKVRAFIQAGNALIIAFLLALLMIYLFLVAQYESLRDPLVVLISVPMSICGALIFLCVDVVPLSLFSQVGLITLIGLISKHGILMVDFARHMQEQGMSRQDAIIEAASVRLRPILMTTAAIVMAVLPMLIGSGPGANSRHHIGVVIAAGMTIGTLFTLFVLPVVYSYIAQIRESGAQSETIVQAKHSPDS